MLGQMKRWSKLALSYAGRSYVLTAYVWSRGMSVAAYNRPPPTVLKMLMAASRQFMWTGKVTSGTNARSSASEFPTGSRPTESLTASKADTPGDCKLSLVTTASFLHTALKQI